jgi:hypothetical protein
MNDKRYEEIRAWEKEHNEWGDLELDYKSYLHEYLDKDLGEDRWNVLDYWNFIVKKYDDFMLQMTKEIDDKEISW